MKRFVAIALMLVMMTALLVPLLSGCKKRGSGVDISFDENGNLLPSSGTTIHVTSYSEGDEEKRSTSCAMLSTKSTKSTTSGRSMSRVTPAGTSRR